MGVQSAELKRVDYSNKLFPNSPATGLIGTALTLS